MYRKRRWISFSMGEGAGNERRTFSQFAFDAFKAMNDPDKIPEAEKGEPPDNVFLDYTNKPGEPLSWSESLEDIIGPDEEEEV
jgi:hypothetical protein